jgi:hypothetical protein
LAVNEWQKLGEGKMASNDCNWVIVLKKSASGAEIIGGWFASEAADRLRRVVAVPASG